MTEMCILLLDDDNEVDMVAMVVGSTLWETKRKVATELKGVGLPIARSISGGVS
jgi:hypothetical protein